MLVIVDGNNLAWAGLFALGKSMGLDTEERKTRAALIGLTQSVLGLVARGAAPPEYPGDPLDVSGLAIAFDSGRPLRRREVYPSYQTGREQTPNFIDNEPAVSEAIAQFMSFARLLPCRVVKADNTEADDLAAAVALRETGRVRIASSDRDFLQLVDGRVSVYSPIKRVIIDTGNFEDQTAPKNSKGAASGFPRERYLDYRAASGDASDDLPGIPGVGALTAARLLGANPLDAYLDDAVLAVSTLGRRNVKLEGAIRSGEAREIVERNRSLMDLRLAAARYPDMDPHTRWGAWDETGVRGWLSKERIPRVDLNSLAGAFSAMAEA